MRLRASTWAAAVKALGVICALGAGAAWAASPVEIKEAFLQEAESLRRHRLNVLERRYGDDVAGDRALPSQARPLALDLRLALRRGAVPRLVSARVDDFPPISKTPVAAAVAGAPEWLTLNLQAPAGTRLLRLSLEWAEGGRSHSEEALLPLYIGPDTDRMRLALSLEKRLRAERLVERNEAQAVEKDAVKNP